MIPRTTRPNRKRPGPPRRGPWRSEAYRRWVASHPCIISGEPAQAAHVTHNGMSSKGPDSEIVPLAPIYHDELDGRRKLPNGERGKAAFEKYYRVNLLEIAGGFYREWREEQGIADQQAETKWEDGQEYGANRCPPRE